MIISQFVFVIFRHTDLLRASMLLAGLMLGRGVGCDAASGVSGRASRTGAVSIASGLGLLSWAVRGKTIGIDRGLVWGNPAERRGWGTTWVTTSLFPFLTWGKQRCQRQVSVSPSRDNTGRKRYADSTQSSSTGNHRLGGAHLFSGYSKTCFWSSPEVKQRAIKEL